MKNASLADINFRQLLHYGGQPIVRNDYRTEGSSPLACTGYCVQCESTGVLDCLRGTLDLMSHGCDTADFEAILGQLPQRDEMIAAPVVFLLQSPWQRYPPNGEVVCFEGYSKQPPVNHYYWSPIGPEWPSTIREVIESPHYYGPYFAYLMNRHRLSNVYITNVSKCRYMPDEDERAKRVIAMNCADLFLHQEIAAFEPRLVLCFGGRTHAWFAKYQGNHFTRLPSCLLLHPQARGAAQARFEENDRRIGQAIEEHLG